MSSYVHRDAGQVLRALEAFVRGLSRQWHRRLYLRYVLDAVFWGLICAAVAVFWARVLQLPWSSSRVVTLVTLCSLCCGLLLAYRRRSDPLLIAIAADRVLKLKQRLSTAWEFRQKDPDSAVTLALAKQALSRRLPPPAEPVFPLRLSVWGMLLPLAGAVFWLAATIDLQGLDRDRSMPIDTQVVDEGRRLRSFAQAMKLLAERERYPRSFSEAGSLERLAAQMEAGALAREQAIEGLKLSLERMVSQRSAALAEATGAGSDAVPGGSSPVLDEVRGLQLTDMLNRLLSGQLLPGDVHALQQASTSLAELGVSPEQLAQALDRYEAGKADELERLLETLSSTDRAYRDARELSKAEQRVARAHENLAGSARLNDTQTNTAGLDSNPAGNADNARSSGGVEGGGYDTGASSVSSGWDTERSLDELPGASQSNPEQPGEHSEVILRPRGVPRAGESTQTETWALPRVGEVASEHLTLDPQFKTQLEEVLSKESYPLHRKEFVRRYFIGLSGSEAQQ